MGGGWRGREGGREGGKRLKLGYCGIVHQPWV